MTLSDALIYLGICFMVLGIMMIAAARKSKKKACGIFHALPGASFIPDGTADLPVSKL